MNTIQKLDQATWCRQLLKSTQEEFRGVDFEYKETQSYAGEFSMIRHEHPIVKKYYVHIAKAIADMRKEIEAEMDGLFK